MADWTVVRDYGLPVQDEYTKTKSLETLLRDHPEFISGFAVEVIGDSSESWFVRSEACRLIRDVEMDNWSDLGLCQVLLKILNDDDQDLTLRQWAAFLVGKCQDNCEIADLVAQLIVQSDDLQWNLLEPLEESEMISPAMKKALTEITLTAPLDSRVRATVAKLIG